MRFDLSTPRKKLVVLMMSNEATMFYENRTDKIIRKQDGSWHRVINKEGLNATIEFEAPAAAALDHLHGKFLDKVMMT